MTIKCGVCWIAGLLLSTVLGPMNGMAQNAMPGGTEDISATNIWVMEAADNAIKLKEKALGANPDGRLVQLSLAKIMRAQVENTKGPSFRLRLRVRLDKTEKEAETVVTRKPNGDYDLIMWEWK